MSLVARNWPRNPSPQAVAGVRAPCLWRVLPLEVSINASSTGAAVKYRWQRPLVIVHMQLLTKSGVDGDVAALDLAWEDGQGDQVATTGLAGGKVAGFALAGDASMPQWSKWAALEMPVKHNDVHTFQITNNHASRAITPILLFHCVEQATL